MTPPNVNVNVKANGSTASNLGTSSLRNKRPRVSKSSSSSIFKKSSSSSTDDMDRRRNASASAPRKLTIRAYKQPPKLTLDQVRQSWQNQLGPAVQSVHNSTPISFSLEELYRLVEHACMHKYGPELYKLLRDTCDTHIANEIASLPSSGSTTPGAVATNSTSATIVATMGKKKKKIEENLIETTNATTPSLHSSRPTSDATTLGKKKQEPNLIVTKSSTPLLTDTDTFLKAVETVWHRHCTHMLRIRAIFLYLDRTYIAQGCSSGISNINSTTNNILKNNNSHDNNSNIGIVSRPDVRSFWEMGLVLFRRHLSTTRDVQDCTVSGVLSLVDRERDGDAIDNSMLKNLLGMFSAVGTYDMVLEKAFLAATDRYYRNESARLVSTLDVPKYLIHAERRILEESDRTLRTLDPRTRIPLISTVERRLVSDHVVTLLDKGFSMMCDEGRKDDIKRCYNVLSRANEHMPADSDNAHELMKARLIEYVKGVGRGIVHNGPSTNNMGARSSSTTNTDKDAGMVQALLDLKARLDDLVTYSFNGADNFHNAVNLAFESFVNARENKPAELIAKFIDGILRTGNRGFTEEQLENTLDKVLTLFRFIDGKDVFEAFYKKDLAKRLLYDKSASLDLEKSMISKLKTECGSQFTSKLEAMFRDVDASKDLMQSFNTHAASRERLGGAVELNVFVLEAARWPLSSAASSVKLPQALMDYHETYKRFYLTKHNGRKLSWQHTDGSCTVKGRFPKGEKILIMSLYQTIVLVLFNDVEEMSYGDILEATGIDEAELKRTLLTLALGKARVLVKEPKNSNVDAQDKFKLNLDFTHRQIRIKVNNIQMKQSVEENAATTEKVFQERNYQIDAALVRIMKTRRTLQHTTLIEEVIRHLRFKHKVGDIKKRIESLIEREYLERDENNPQTYHYLA